MDYRCGRRTMAKNIAHGQSERKIKWKILWRKDNRLRRKRNSRNAVKRQKYNEMFFSTVELKQRKLQTKLNKNGPKLNYIGREYYSSFLLRCFGMCLVERALFMCGAHVIESIIQCFEWKWKMK